MVSCLNNVMMGPLGQNKMDVVGGLQASLLGARPFWQSFNQIGQVTKTFSGSLGGKGMATFVGSATVPMKSCVMLIAKQHGGKVFLPSSF